MQCTAQSKQNHRQCRRHAIPGAKVCASHGGNAPQVKAAARVRLAMAADTLMAQLLKIAMSSEDERVRLAAVNSALDRAGLGAKQELEISQEPTQFDQLITTILRRGETGALSDGRALPSPLTERPAVVLDPLPEVFDGEPVAEPAVIVKQPAATRPRTRQAARERQVLVDAGEPVPGHTPTQWN